MKIRMANASMQFSDSPAQMRSDADKIFDRAVDKNYAWITGSEAGGGNELSSILRNVTWQYNYRFYNPAGCDSWIAVARDFVDSSWSVYYDKVLDGVKGRYTDKGVTAVKFINNDIGEINVITCHLLTDGRKPGDPRYSENMRLLKNIGDYGTKVARGKALAFYGGDQNIVDRTDDTFKGQPFTSAWDELRKYEDTGHGNIDVIASYDGDHRTKAVSINALDDSEFRLYTDHFLVEATYEVPRL